LPVSVRNLGAGLKARLTEAHSQFLIEYVNQYPAAILSDIRQNLCEAFPGSSISISALHRHLVRKCKLTLKKLEKLHAARNSDRALKLRMEKIEEWEAMSGMDFARNRVFIYEGRIHSAYTATLRSLSKRHANQKRFANGKRHYNYHLRLHITGRGHRYLIEETSGCLNIQKEKSE
jgi:hypothetical protein